MLFGRIKKGQSATGSGAAALIAVITLLIVFYFLLIPVEERQRLLDSGRLTVQGGDEEVEYNTTLLSVYPKRLPAETVAFYEYNIPSFTLFQTTESETLRTVNPFYIVNKWFSKVTKNVTFEIEDLQNTDNVLLSFNAQVYSGFLNIYLNGVPIFENYVTSYNVPPIVLDKKYLQNNNFLFFEPASVGFKFWRKNEFSLENVKITADVTDISRQESRNTFFIPESRFFYIDEGTLKFIPECNPADVGKLDVYLNNYQLISAVPDCGVTNIYPFSPRYLVSGTNKLVFKTSKGSYLVDRIKVETDMKEVDFPVYYFEISDEQWDDIDDDVMDVNLSIVFAEGRDIKEGKLTINGRVTSFYQREQEYSRIIDSFVQKGNNALRVEPLTDLDVIGLKIELV